ncbi:secondary thiamine-phosphate synthase enzyme YjbQ [Parabacteroides sp. FAFU027]|uniref:secondary thiamine-phosphate synthase enzyme YjbQ n=1 Tax=Parabacteroides sp. FAFU027 TaxID=2922715 RepID=UPI001FAEE110|nr:secondary thiamine-phosphate synthase enzyme YjbQ [Parabacteroides sp. FAFU027]
MVNQVEFNLRQKRRGVHLITDEVIQALPELPLTGILHLFIKHTSAALSINENADPSVREDMNRIFDHVVPENQYYFTHTLEGDDDMPAHAKATFVGSNITIPISRGRLNLGTWQGIYLCEFRNYGGSRRIVATIMG